jgi:hypothetical protein
MTKFHSTKLKCAGWKMTLILLLLVIFTGCSTDYKIYCRKDDPSSIRLIPKRDPNIKLRAAIIKYLTLTTQALQKNRPEVSTEYISIYDSRLRQMQDTTFIQLFKLTSYYQVYRTRPCDESAYRDYISRWDTVNNNLINIKDLYLDTKRLIEGGGITGNSTGALLERITKYLATRNEKNQ